MTPGTVGFWLTSVAAPALFFPELLPEASRVWLATLLGIAAFAAAHAELRHHGRPIALSTTAFSAIVIAAWMVLPSRDAAAVRHFCGIALGVWAMAAFARLRPTRHLVLATLLYTLAAGAVMVIGLAGTEVNTGKFIGALRELPLPFAGSLPQIRLPLPGLDSSGMVNPNALGGTALMVLPVCIVAARIALSLRWHAAALGAGLVSTMAILTLLTTRSRSALFGAVIVVLVWTLFRLRKQRVALAALAVTMGAGAYWVSTYGGEAHLLRDSVMTRLDIWSQALERIRESPWLGVGLNQFHDIVPIPEEGVPPRVAHAHNIFMQVLMDTGVFGAAAYGALLGLLLYRAGWARTLDGNAGRIAAAAGLSLVGVHLFGLTDAIAPGAKVGIFQWLSAGLILAATRTPWLPVPRASADASDT